MSVRRNKQINSRVHSLPSNAVFIEFERTDGKQDRWPRNTTKQVDADGSVNFMRPVTLDENIAVLWRKQVGKFVAKHIGKPEGPDYVLKSWPANYQLYDHNKGPVGNPRHDPYLYGSTSTARFRSANEFAPHAAWLLSDPTLDRANCECKYCSGNQQRQISLQKGLSTSKRGSEAPSSIGPRKRARQAKVHAAVRRAPKPVRPLPAPTREGPSQWEVLEKNGDIMDALGKRETRAIRYFRRGEVVWCSLNPAIGTDDGKPGIQFWPGLIDTATTKVETHPKPSTRTGSVQPHIAPSASRPSSPVPGATLPPPEITWTVIQHTSYKIKLLATSCSILLSEDDVLPYLAHVPPDPLMEVLAAELPEALQSPAVAELDGPEPKMFVFDPTAAGDPLTRFKDSIAPYSLAIHMASKMARYWTPTDEWECKFTPPSPKRESANGALASASVSQPPPPSQPEPVHPSLHDLINSTMAHNAHTSGALSSASQPGDEVEKRMLGEQLPQGTLPVTITQLRYQGLWWGAERIWTDELVRLKLSRAQFAPQGNEAVLPPAGPSEATRQWNKEHGLQLDEELAGSGEKGLFMRLEGLFVVELPNPEVPGTTIKEPRATGMLFELVEEDWKDEDTFHRVADALPIDPLLENENAQGTSTAPPPISGSGSTIVASVPPAATTETRVNDQLSHAPNADRYPLPDPPKGYKFHPIIAPDHEIVLSLSLISGRYYPHLLEHPLLQPTLEKARRVAGKLGGLFAFRQLWALEGLLPGVHQSMEPTYWKNGRHVMLKDASAEAKKEFDDRRGEIMSAKDGLKTEDVAMGEGSQQLLPSASSVSVAS